MKISETIKKIYRWWYIRKKHIINIESFFPCSRKIRRKMIKKGFIPDQYYLYGFNKGNKIDEYITEYERWKIRYINGNMNFILDNKIVFYDVFHNELPIPKNKYLILNKKILNEQGILISENDFSKISGTFIIKPIAFTGGGRGIKKIEFNEGVVSDNKGNKYDSYNSFCENHNNYIINEIIRQDNYASIIAPHSLNTIRIITIRDKMTEQCKCYLAIHRFGTLKSGPVDNTCSGGLFSKIDIKSSTLGISATHFSVEKYERHPDFDTRIMGVKIPNLHKAISKLTEVHNKRIYLQFIAWDVAFVDNDNFVVIEGNGSSDTTFLQIFGGLRNEEYGKVLSQYGLLVKRKH